jgi:hypothetical protein
LLAARLGDGGLDLASPQVGADCPVGVGLVAQHPAGSGAWSAAAPAADSDASHHRLERQTVVAVTGGGDPREGSAAGVGREMNLGRQAASGASECFPARLSVGTRVIQLRPLCRPRWWRGPPRRCRLVAGGGRRPRGDARVPPRRRSLPSTPNPRHGRHPGVARRGFAPRSYRLTSGDAGYTQSSSSLTPRGDPAMVTHYGSARALHQSPVDDQSIGHPAAASAQATTAPTEPFLISQVMTIVHRDDLSHPSP